MDETPARVAVELRVIELALLFLAEHRSNIAATSRKSTNSFLMQAIRFLEPPDPPVDGPKSHDIAGFSARQRLSAAGTPPPSTAFSTSVAKIPGEPAYLEPILGAARDGLPPPA
jgi:hypothetical protein